MTTIDVKAGDTVTVRADFSRTDTPEAGEAIVTGLVWADYRDNPHSPVLKVGVYHLRSANVTITDHQPAEPEWKPGTVGTATVVYGGDPDRTAERTVFRTARFSQPWTDELGNDLTDDEVTAFVPDDDEALRTAITKLIVQLDEANAEVGEMETEIKERRAEVERLRAAMDSSTHSILAQGWHHERNCPARTMPTREQVAELMRKKFGGLLEAWLDDADEIRALFEQGGAELETGELPGSSAMAHAVRLWAERFRPGDAWSPQDARDLEAAITGTVENDPRMGGAS